MDLSHSRPGEEEGDPGAGPPGGLLWEQVCDPGGRRLSPCALGLGLLCQEPSPSRARSRPPGHFVFSPCSPD